MKKFYWGLMALAAVAMTACSSDEPEEVKDDTTDDDTQKSAVVTSVTAMQEMAMGGAYYQSLVNLVYENMMSMPLGAPELTGMRSTPSIDGTVITVTYDEAGELCSDGITRAGQVMIDTGGDFMLSEEGTTWNITFDGFRQNGALMDGEVTCKSMGMDMENYTLTLQFTVKNGSVTYDDGKTFLYEQATTNVVSQTDATTDGGKVMTQQVTGTMEGASSDGIAFSATVSEPLSIASNSAYITGGKVSATVGEYPAVSLDFSDGAAGNVTITVDALGLSQTVRMPY